MPKRRNHDTTTEDETTDESTDNSTSSDDSDDDADDEDWMPPLRLVSSASSMRTMFPRRVKLTPTLTAATRRPAQPPPRKRRVIVSAPPFKVDTWAQLLDLARKTKALPEGAMYRDCRQLPALLEPLEEIDKLIGLDHIKQALCDYIVFHVQLGSVLRKPPMNHMVLSGPPGCGKTTLARCIGRLFCRMGHLKSEDVIIGTRTTMVAGYVGQTAMKTQTLINRAIRAGAVLLIDEAHTLGCGGKDGDSFSQEAVDCLNENLSAHGQSFMCILAGYKDLIERQLFALNEGLARRFQWSFELSASNGVALAAILRKMVADEGLTVDAGVGTVAWFKERIAKFPRSGGSVENLVSKLKIAHSKRVFGEPTAQKGHISAADLDQAFALYERFEQSTRDDADRHLHTIYN